MFDIVALALPFFAIFFFVLLNHGMEEQVKQESLSAQIVRIFEQNPIPIKCKSCGAPSHVGKKCEYCGNQN